MLKQNYLLNSLTVSDQVTNENWTKTTEAKLLGIKTNPFTLMNSLIGSGGTPITMVNGDVTGVEWNIVNKSAVLRDVTSTVSGGTVTAGMYGAETSDTFGYIKPSLFKMGKMRIDMNATTFFKELHTFNDIEYVVKRLEAWKAQEDFRVEQEFLNMLVNVTNPSTYNTELFPADYLVTVAGATGDGQRNEFIDPTNITLADISNKLRGRHIYFKNIGKYVEQDHPFALGQPINFDAYWIAPEMNTIITNIIGNNPQLVKEIAFLGISYDVTQGKITKIKDTPCIEVEELKYYTDHNGNTPLMGYLPRGEMGALLFPRVEEYQANVRPHYEGISNKAVIIEGVGQTYGKGYGDNTRAWMFVGAGPVVNDEGVAILKDGAIQYKQMERVQEKEAMKKFKALSKKVKNIKE